MKAIRYFRFWGLAGLCGSVFCSGLASAGTTAARVFGGTPITSEALARQRGGTEVQISNEAWLKGTVRDNQAVNVQTGSNLIGGASFAGAAGFITALQNSGNNVLFQNSTIVNVQVR